MVIYMVECGFMDLGREAAWNDWYSGHLQDIMAVPEFRTAQRFIAVGSSVPKYRAMYTLESSAAFESSIYKGFKGGNFPAEWRPAITDFYRNLFDAGTAAPMVDNSSSLIIVDEPVNDTVVGFSLAIWSVVGLDKSVATRGIGIVSKAEGDALAARRLQGIGVYAALTKQISKIS
jgi:hypothetical protein